MEKVVSWHEKAKCGKEKNEQSKEAQLPSRLVDMAIGAYFGEFIQLTNQELQLASLFFLDMLHFFVFKRLAIIY